MVEPGVKNSGHRLTDLLSGYESQLGFDANYLVVPQGNVAYSIGTVLPVLDPRTTAGGQSTTSPRLSGSAPASHDYIGTYITFSDYLSEFGDDLQTVADSHRREALIIALARLNRLHDKPQELQRLTSDFLQVLPGPIAERLQRAFRVPSGGMGRRLIAPLPILLALRWLVSHPPLSEPLNDTTSGLHAVVFSQLCEHRLQAAEAPEGEEVDDPRSLMLTFMNLGSLGEQVDYFASIDRTVRLWNEYGSLAEELLGRDAATLFRDCTGVTVEDVIAVGFGLASMSGSFDAPGPPLVDRNLHPNTLASLREPVLTIISRTLQQFYDEVPPPRSIFDFVAFESHPVVELSGGLVVVDSGMLWRRVTSGLFWIVHDSLKVHSELEADRFRSAYGAMVESLVEDSLRAMAPPALGGGTTFYTEEDLEAAYGLVKRCDSVIDFGDSLLVVEIVSGRLTVPTRAQLDLTKLEQDFDRLVLAKCEQIEATTRLLVDDELPLTGIPSGTRYPQVVPVLVVGGGIQINPLSYSFIQDRIRGRGLFAHPRVGRLSVIDLDDVDELEGLTEQGWSASELLTAWQSSDHRDVPLQNYILRQQLPDARRPARMADVVDATFEDIIDRLNLPRPNDPGSRTSQQR